MRSIASTSSRSTSLIDVSGDSWANKGVAQNAIPLLIKAAVIVLGLNVFICVPFLVLLSALLGLPHPKMPLMVQQRILLGCTKREQRYAYVFINKNKTLMKHSFMSIFYNELQ
jgi:hypothetical protein